MRKIFGIIVCLVMANLSTFAQSLTINVYNGVACMPTVYIGAHDASGTATTTQFVLTGTTTTFSDVTVIPKGPGVPRWQMGGPLNVAGSGWDNVTIFFGNGLSVSSTPISNNVTGITTYWAGCSNVTNGSVTWTDVSGNITVDITY